MKKILVLGIKGMAGHLIFKSLPQLGNYQVFGLARNLNQKTENIFDLDVLDTLALEKIIAENKFDIIINCIGILNKDAEENPDKSIWFNSFFPHFLEKTTKKSTTKVIHISTDCVFSGKKGSYTESDFRDGTGFYAMSKTMGEIDNDKDLTIRTSIIGPELNKNGIGLFHWFMQQKGEVIGYSQAFWSGITTIELAKVIHQTIVQDVKGLLIVAGNPKIDKCSLLKLFNLIFRNNELTIIENENYKVDKSMYSSRLDLDYQVPSYKEMVVEMKEWIDTNTYDYNYN